MDATFSVCVFGQEGTAGEWADYLRTPVSFVRVPNIVGESLSSAFRSLGLASGGGFLEAIPVGFTLVGGQKYVVGAQSPQAGTLMAPGSIVSITPRLVRPTHPYPASSRSTERVPAYRLPNFAESLPRAVIWLNTRRIPWEVELSSISATQAFTIFYAYHVIDQSPAPGTIWHRDTDTTILLRAIPCPSRPYARC